MSRARRNPAQDLRGAARLAVTGATKATELVGSMHSAIAPGPAVLAGVAYRSVGRAINLAGAGIDRVLAQVEPLFADAVPGAPRGAFLAALNGVVGDHLAATQNPLAIEMCLRLGGRPLNFEAPMSAQDHPGVGGRILVLLHGLCADDGVWRRDGHDHGAALAADLGYTPVYLNFNSGLHISENGRLFSAQMQSLVRAWPVPVEEIVLLGHSMGGLVARSACHDGIADGSWRSKVSTLVCLGTPHHGAPLERSGNIFEWMLGVSRYSAPLQRLAKLRSAGITDLRYGSFLEAHWAGRDRFEIGGDTRQTVALPDGVDCYAIAGTLSPAGRRTVRGDGMVPVSSALGRHRDPQLTLDFGTERQHLAYQTGHVGLLGSVEVYRRLVTWLAPA